MSENDLPNDTTKRPRGRPPKPEEEKIKQPKPKKENPRPIGRPLLPDSVFRSDELIRKYRREYYHNKLKIELVCPHCDLKVNSKISLNQHMKQNKNCQIQQLKKQVEEAYKDK
jgi:hypothetical protein